VKLSPGESWKVEEVEGVRFVWLRTTPYSRNDWRRVLNMASFAVRARHIARQLPQKDPALGKPDVIIGSSPHPLAALVAQRLAGHWRKRFVFEIRDLWPQTLVDMSRLHRHSPVVAALRILESLLCRHAASIVVVLPGGKDYLRELGVDQAKVWWVPNGVDLTRFPECPMSDEEISGFSVIYAGALGETNGLNVLLEAAEQVGREVHNQIRFILVGDGPEKPGLLALAEKLRLENIEFLPPVPKACIPSILARASVLVHVERTIPHLSKYGSSPNKIYDYMAAARPIVVSSCFVRESVEAIGCGLEARPDDPQAIADCVLRLFAMPRSARTEMGVAGRSYVAEHRDLNRLADSLAEACLGAGRGDETSPHRWE
jgi:glycosyltransferase involved in cell wall biosynthesis